MNLNRLLKRQIKKNFGSVENIPKEFLPFIESVNQSYTHYENDRKLLENTMDVNSKELTESNRLLRSVAHSQNKLLENLKDSVNELRSSNSNAINIKEEIKLENIGEIIQQEIRIKNQHEESLKKSERSQEYQYIIQNIISRLLILTHKNGDLETLMSEALDILLELPFGEDEPKIGLYLANNEVLKLIAYKNFKTNPNQIDKNNTIPFGKYLCGKAAKEKTTIFTPNTSENPIIDSSESHGQFNIPILSRDEVLGVIVFYLPKDYTDNEDETDTLNSIASTLSLILNKNKADKEMIKIKMAIEQSESSIVITNAKNEIEYVNPFFEKLSGYSFKEVKGKNPKLIRSNHTTSLTYKNMWETLNTKGKWKGEICNKKKNGDLFWENVNISTIKDSQGNATNYVAVKDDITAQKELAHILKRKEKEYKQIVESANDVIYRSDENGKFKYANPLLSKISEYSNTELMKMHLLDLVDSDYKKDVEKFYRNQFLNLQANSYKEFIIKSKSGKRIWLGQNVQAVIKNNKVISFTSVARDITEIKEIQNELVHAKEIAEDSARSKEMFLANMSHEIRTPMNAIIGMTNLLTESKLSQKQKEYLNAIQTSGDNLLVIINDILDISKIESGKLEVEKIDFNIKELLSNTKKSIQLKAEEKDLIFSLNIQEEIPNILISDPVRLNQILINLLGNSIKFTNSGKIELNCSLIKKVSNSATIKIEVIDTGVGINSKKIDKIFESFSQEDESTTRKFGGTGLGLSISKQLVELLGGKLNVESEIGKGSNFYFTLNLPIGEKKEKKKKIIINTETNPLKNKRILLVEDNEINRFLATTVLAKWEIIVDVAEDGKVAIDKINKNNYDIVLMDIQMPVMGGVEATHIIRNELKLNVPIIALTANAVKGDKEEFLNAGMDDYISKPFDASILFNKLVAFTIDIKQNI
ncbi:MAG: PAS domain S-box protein [Vicingaceae bacterium]